LSAYRELVCTASNKRGVFLRRVGHQEPVLGHVIWGGVLLVFMRRLYVGLVIERLDLG